MEWNKKVDYRLTLLQQLCNPPQIFFFRATEFSVVAVILGECVADPWQWLGWTILVLALAFALTRLYFHTRKWSCQRSIEFVPANDDLIPPIVREYDLKRGPSAGQGYIRFQAESGEFLMPIAGLRMTPGLCGIRVVDNVYGHYVLVPTSVVKALALETVFPRQWHGKIKAATQTQEGERRA